MSEIVGRVGDARSVLLRAPALGGDVAACRELLRHGADAGEPPNVLFVTYTRGVDACLAELDGEVGEATREVAVVGVGIDADPREGVRTETVASPGDLTGLGITVGDVIDGWEPPITVCFESLTAMLQYVGFETAYEFLHVMLGRLQAAGARVHAHVDPAAHDDRELAGLTSLFDASVAPAEGEVRVRESLG